MFLELQNAILEMVARGEPVCETARRLCIEAETIAGACICSILTVDATGSLRPLAGPSLPPSYVSAIDGVKIGPKAGSCGTAMYRSEAVTVRDIATDVLWEDYKELALSIGLKACWSTPIFGASGRAIGAFAFYFFTPRGPNEVERGIVDMLVHLCSIAIDRHEAEAENRRLAYFDSLTGLANRASYDEALEAAADGDGALGLLLIDVDRLKLVNDTLGHAGGDDLLRAIGSRIASWAPDGRAYRLGGDEFAVLVTGPEAGERMQWVADAILEAMRPTAICAGRSLHPMVTIGGALFGKDGSTVMQLRQNADFALYHAKEKFRSGYVRFSAGLGSTITQRYLAIRDVHEALEEDRVEAHYQPVTRIETGEIIGVEALCRVMDHDGRRMPAEAFQLAMTDGATAARITERMLNSIACDMRHWLDAGIPFQHVGVNVTTGDFQTGDLDRKIASIFGRYGVPLNHVILEVTEMVYMGDADLMVAEAVKALRAQGLLVALDDFGTGYASLTHLLTFPVDIIKIDRSFVTELKPGTPSAAIVGALLDIARKLGMRVVAEGVETADQAKQLARLGCRLGQGYYYARPCNFEAVTRLIRERGQHMPHPAAPVATAQSAA